MNRHVQLSLAAPPIPVQAAGNGAGDKASLPRMGKRQRGSLARLFADLEGGRSLSRSDELTVTQPANPALFCHLKACTSHDTQPWVPLPSLYVWVVLTGTGRTGDAQAGS